MSTSDNMTAEKKSIRFIDRDMLKYIAVFFMFIGHFFTYTAKELHGLGIPKPLLRIFLQLQFIAPPIFFFCIAEGFHYTRDKKKYARRLAVLAVVTQFFYMIYPRLTFDINRFLTDWNVIATLFLALMMLIVWESKRSDTEKVLYILGLMYLGSHTEWTITGMVIIFTLHIFRERPKKRLIAYELVIIGDLVIKNRQALLGVLSYSSISYFLTLSASMLLITFFYNGKKGRHPKFSQWFFYVFYPAHLLLVIIVKLIFR